MACQSDSSSEWIRGPRRNRSAKGMTFAGCIRRSAAIVEADDATIEVQDMRGEIVEEALPKRH